ncbi:MAG: O-antigen ligase family protein, partial [Pseudomonadota bacterium]
LFVLGLISVSSAVDPWYSLHELRGELLKGILIYFLAVNNLRTEKRAAFVLGALLSGALVQTGYGLGHFLAHHGSFSSPSLLEAGLHRGPQELGTYLVQAAPFFFLGIFYFRKWPSRSLMLLAASLCVLVGYMTFSRTVIVVLGVEIALVLFLLGVSWKVLAGLSLAAFAALVIILPRPVILVKNVSIFDQGWQPVLASASDYRLSVQLKGEGPADAFIWWRDSKKNTLYSFYLGRKDLSDRYQKFENVFRMPSSAREFKVAFRLPGVQGRQSNSLYVDDLHVEARLSSGDRNNSENWQQVFVSDLEGAAGREGLGWSTYSDGRTVTWKWGLTTDSHSGRFAIYLNVPDDHVHWLHTGPPIGVLASNNMLRLGGVAVLGLKSSRFLLWQTSLEYVLKHPLRGVGYGRSSFSKKFPELKQIHPHFWHAHNTFINLALQLGLPGLLAFCFLIYRLLRWLYISPDGNKWFKTGNMTAFFMAAAWVMIIGNFLRNMTDDIFNNDAAFLFWLLVGCAFSLDIHGRRLKEGPHDQAEN